MQKQKPKPLPTSATQVDQHQTATDADGCSCRIVVNILTFNFLLTLMIRRSFLRPSWGRWAPLRCLHVKMARSTTTRTKTSSLQLVRCSVSCLYSLNFARWPPLISFFKGIIWLEFHLRVSAAFTAYLFRVTLDGRDIVQVQNDISSGTGHPRLTLELGRISASLAELVRVTHIWYRLLWMAVLQEELRCFYIWLSKFHLSYSILK